MLLGAVGVVAVKRRRHDIAGGRNHRSARIDDRAGGIHRDTARQEDGHGGDGRERDRYAREAIHDVTPKTAGLTAHKVNRPMVKTSLTMTPRMSEILFATRLYKARTAP